MVDKCVAFYAEYLGTFRSGDNNLVLEMYTDGTYFNAYREYYADKYQHLGKWEIRDGKIIFNVGYDGWLDWDSHKRENTPSSDEIVEHISRAVEGALLGE